MRWSFLQTPTRCRVGVGGKVVSRVSQRMAVKVTLDTSTVKRYTPPNSCGGDDGPGEAGAASRHSGARPILPASGTDRLRRSGRPRGSDGARARRGAEVADQGGDARGYRGLPVAAGPLGHPGRYLDLLHSRGLLGRVGGRLGLYPSELRHRHRVGRTLRPLWRPLRGEGDLLRSEEHTSELQSHHDLVCRLLLEKKKK